MTRHILTTLLCAMSGFLLSSAQAAARMVEGVSNVEDLAPTPDGRWVFAGSGVGGPAKTGWIALIDARSGKVRRAYAPGSATAPGLAGNCPGEVPVGKLMPHGIALSPQGDTLYVVNHGGRESVEIFRVVMTVVPRLRWIGCVIAPAGYVMNSVAAALDGTIFTTNWPLPIDLKTFASLKGSVFAWTPKAGWNEVAGSEVVTPNGLLVSPDGKTLYISAYAQHAVVELRLMPAGPRRRTVSMDFMTDNLRWGIDGSLTVAGQKASIADIGRCAGSDDSECDIAGFMAKIDRRDFKIVCERPVPFSFATTAVDVGREIWVSRYRGPSILRLGAESLSGPNCPS